MITCPKCQKMLEDGTKFCDACGEKIEATIYCPSCGNATSAEYAFCQVCGASLNAAPAAPAAAPAKAKKKLPKKLLAVGAAAVAAIALIVVVLAIVLSGGKNNYALYLKDNEIFFTQISKIAPMQLTDDMFGDYDDEASAPYRSYNYVMSKDGKNIFYADEYELDGDNGKVFSLYYRSAKDAKKEPVKLESGVSSFSVSEDGKTVLYFKDGAIYQHDLKEKSKVVDEYADWDASDDLKTVFWTDEDGDLYMKKAGQDKKKLDSEVGVIRRVNEKGTAVWYTKNVDEKTGEFDLFKHDTKDKKKQVSEVTSVYALNDEGEFFYIKKETEKKTYYDFVTGESDNEYLVNALKETEYEQEIKTLYYFDGKGGKELSANYFDYESTNADANIMIYAEAKEVKVKLSEVESLWDVEDALEDPECTYFVAVGANTKEIDADDAEDFQVTEDGEAIYYMSDFTELKKDATEEEKEKFVRTGALAKLTISDGKIKKSETYTDDVYGYMVYEDGTVICAKDYKNGKYDDDKYIPGTYTLYVNKEKVADDVNDFEYNAESGAVAFQTDYDADEDKQCGTLNYWKDGKKKKIADDVYSYSMTPEGEVTYLKDYSVKKSRGDLFLYNGKKSVKIDEDVTRIIPVYIPEY